jgi:hypothetical protein
MGKVDFDFPKWRVWLFPFYSAYEVIFILLLVIAAAAMAYVLKFPETAWQYGAAGYVGAALINRGSSPAHVVYPNELKRDVEHILLKNGLHYDNVSASWLSRLPRFLLWKHGRVSLIVHNEGLEVRAPYRFLVYLNGEIVELMT